MIWAAVLMALAIGWVGGVLVGARHAREAHVENERLRALLRQIRRWLRFSPGHRHILDAIERALDDEAGA